jgi:hypothetical protein
VHKKTLLFALLILSSFTGRPQYLNWAKQAHAAALGLCQPYGISVDAVGNVYTTGYFAGTVDFDPGPGAYNLVAGGEATFIQKLDASGNFVWAKQFAAMTIARSISADSFGNVYITGEFQGAIDFDPGPGTFTLTSHGSFDAFLVKLDSAGNFVYAAQFGGTGDDYGESVVTDHLGNVYLAGYFSKTVDFDPSPGVYNISAVPTTRGNGFLVKLDSSGSFLFAKDIGASSGTGTTAKSFGTAVAVDYAENIYLTGTFADTIDFDPGAGVYSMISASGAAVFANTFVSKLNPSGGFMWARQIGGIAGCSPTAIGVDISGNVLVSGVFDFTIDLDPGAAAFDVTCISTTGYQNVYIDKLSPSGDFVWGCMVGSPDIIQAYSLCLDKSASVYTTGMFRNTVNFDPGAGSHLLSAGSTPNVYVQKLDSNGHFVSAIQNAVSGSAVNAQSTGGIAIDAKRNIYLAGIFQGGYDFDPAAGTFIMSSLAGATDAFIEKLFQYKFGADTATSCGNYSIGGSTYTTTGTYYDTLTTGLGIDSIVTLSITINPMPHAGFITGTGDSICHGATITLTDTATGGVWSVANSHATMSGAIVTGVTTGRDTITYTVANSCGSDHTVYPIYVKNCTASGVASTSAEEMTFQIVPNPNNGMFNVSFSSGIYEQAFVTITNIMGQRIKEFTVYANRENPVSLDVPAGMYFLTATDQNMAFTAKIVVAK